LFLLELPIADPTEVAASGETTGDAQKYRRHGGTVRDEDRIPCGIGRGRIRPRAEEQGTCEGVAGQKAPSLIEGVDDAVQREARGKDDGRRISTIEEFVAIGTPGTEDGDTLQQEFVPDSGPLRLPNFEKVGTISLVFQDLTESDGRARMVELSGVSTALDGWDAVRPELKTVELRRIGDGEVEAGRMALLSHLVGAEDLEGRVAICLAEGGPGHKLLCRGEWSFSMERHTVQEELGGTASCRESKPWIEKGGERMGTLVSWELRERFTHVDGIDHPLPVCWLGEWEDNDVV
jgi:hypothetical protein